MTVMDDEKLPKTIEDGTSSHLERPLEIDPAIEKRIVRKIDLRLMPFTVWIYLLCYMDRSNIGNAKILNADAGHDLLDSTHMTTKEYTIALMVFLVAYSIFEAPSNLAAKALQPNYWLGFLVIGFGAFCTAIAGANSFASTSALRFFLGAFEAEERATRIALFLCSATLAGAFGGAIAFGVGHMDGRLGLEGWRWLFIVEGVPSIVLGILTFLFMPSYPEKAGWLTEEEKAIQVARLGVNSSHGEAKLNWEDAKATLKDVRLYVHYITYMCIGVGVSSLSLFAPTIVSGLGYKNLQAQLFTIPPYAVAYVVTLVLAMISDHKKTRGLVAGGCFLFGTIAFIIQACLPGKLYAARYAMLCISTAGVFAGLPPLCAWISDNVRTTTAGSLATGLNIAFTGPGQIIGVWIYRAQDAPFYRLGHGINAGFLAVGTVLSFSLWWHYTRLNKKLVGTNEPRWIA
ncbi:major facilitator superfamily domain-containing protein [Trichoderma breve]|uniref:Major facilitator superfamily domain-containing protein n=1 Tax=Trichoderma breve TaxID=2034170 RepID=A0A9W9E258_9HYPO|nr:major facilitator superfamily domain-containing protein [Trichoderma breve]KAJ4854809.1 major facilitator superfamily domain-containing protein [Trichoderma breve]